MARVDHEAVLRRFRTFILEAEKPHFGERELFAKIAELEAEEAVSEDLLDRCARLFGVRAVLGRILYRPPETEVPPGADSLRGARAEGPGPPIDPGGHDGSTREEGPAGRRDRAAANA